jgi:hypothetical protein
VLDSLLKHRTTEEWLEAFDKADIPAMPVRTLEELFDDPHLKATGFFTAREHPTEGPITTVASPLDFEKTKGRVPPPCAAHRRGRRGGSARGWRERRRHREVESRQGFDCSLIDQRCHQGSEGRTACCLSRP